MDPEANAATSRAVVGGDQGGRYELLGRLAMGGMAELYLARAVDGSRRGQVVVLKRILPHLSEDPEFVRMFRDEAHLAATLDHPNIVHVYDIGRHREDYFFTMEYVHGENLRAILREAQRKHGAIPLEHVLTIACGVAAALHYAHERVSDDGTPLSIVHRDVSPTNVLVGQDGAVKLVDFGIAKAAAGTHITQAGMLKGKASYMSPEQCRAEPVDRRSDVFAMGILLYEMTTLSRLFRGDNELAILHQVLTGSIPKPSTRRPGYPPGLERIVMRALERERDQRYPTAEALQLDLEAFGREQGLTSSMDSMAAYVRSLFGVKPLPWAEVDAPTVPAGSHPSLPRLSPMGFDASEASGVTRNPTPTPSEEDAPSEHERVPTAPRPVIRPAAPRIRPAPRPSSGITPAEPASSPGTPARTAGSSGITPARTAAVLGTGAPSTSPSGKFQRPPTGSGPARAAAQPGVPPPPTLGRPNTGANRSGSRPVPRTLVAQGGPRPFEHSSPFTPVVPAFEVQAPMTKTVVADAPPVLFTAPTPELSAPEAHTKTPIVDRPDLLPPLSAVNGSALHHGNGSPAANHPFGLAPVRPPSGVDRTQFAPATELATGEAPTLVRMAEPTVPASGIEGPATVKMHRLDPRAASAPRWIEPPTPQGATQPMPASALPPELIDLDVPPRSPWVLWVGVAVVVGVIGMAAGWAWSVWARPQATSKAEIEPEPSEASVAAPAEPPPRPSMGADAAAKPAAVVDPPPPLPRDDAAPSDAADPKPADAPPSQPEATDPGASAAVDAPPPPKRAKKKKKRRKTNKRTSTSPLPGVTSGRVPP